jgi:hypothetical protein
MAARKEMAGAAEHARRQQLERLHYQAELARRRFERADPDNRLVAAELERRWEIALRELRRAQESEAVGDEHENGSAPAELTEELKAAFRDIGRRLPEVWDADLLSRRQRKALLRCLIEKVVLRRIAPTRSRRAHSVEGWAEHHLGGFNHGRRVLRPLRSRGDGEAGRGALQGGQN